MASYQRRTPISTLDTASDGGRQIEEHMIDRQAQGLNEAAELRVHHSIVTGGTIDVGTVALTGANLRVQNRSGVTGYLDVQVEDETLDLSTLAFVDGKHLVVIASTPQTTEDVYTDNHTQDTITDVMTVNMGELAALEGDAANYPTPPPNVIVVAQLSLAAGVWTLDQVVNTPPVYRGNVAQAVADLGQSISNPPTQAEVQAVSDKVDLLLNELRAAFLMDT